MDSLDKVNLSSLDAITEESTKDFVQVGDYKVPKLKRKHIKKMQVVLAPFFAKSIGVDSKNIFSIITDSDFEDLIIATALEVDISVIENLYDNEYKEIVYAFTELNPNFILGVANELITRSQLGIDVTPN